MRHFALYRRVALIGILGSILSFCPVGNAAAEREKPTVETRLGVADVDRILHSYWRTAQAREELERYRRSQAFREKQLEISELEREVSSQRFWFLKRQGVTEEIQEKRRELELLAEKEKERSREREKEAIEEIRMDIENVAGSMGRELELTAIFDSNTPYIIFVDRYGTGISDVTNAVINSLNAR